MGIQSPPPVGGDALAAPAPAHPARDRPFTVVERSPVRRPRGIGFWLATAWLLLAVGAALLAPVLPLDDPNRSDPCTSLAQQLSVGFPPEAIAPTAECPNPTLDSKVGAPPSARHVLGTDEVGRDILARLVGGARVALSVGIIAVGIGMLIGGTLGLLAGYFRGFREGLIMSVVDVMLSLPPLLLMIAIVAFAGQGLRNVIVGVAIVAIPAFARIARSASLTYSEREFVTAATVMGYTHRRILVREVLPNVVPAVSTYALVFIAIAVVAEGSLAFLGLSVPPPSPSWGSMISGGKIILQDAPHVSLVPAAAMFATIVALNFLADGLRGSRGARESLL